MNTYTTNTKPSSKFEDVPEEVLTDPTMRTALPTVDIKDMTPAEAHFERSDTCAIEACAVVAEMRVATVLLDEFLVKFGGDSLEEIKRHYGK